MKKIISIIIILLLSCAFLLSACNDKKFSTGRYYASENFESYIEIFNDNKIEFVNVDFSKIERDIYNYYDGLTVNVAEILVGKCEFDINEDYDEIYVFIVKRACLTLRYDNKNKTLETMGVLYKL